MTTPLEKATRAAIGHIPALAARLDEVDWSDARATREAVDACDVVAERASYGAARIQAERKAREARNAWIAAFPAEHEARAKEADEERAARMSDAGDHGERALRLAD